MFQSAQELKEHIKVAHKGVGSLGGLAEMAQNVEKLQVKERIEKVSAGLSEGIKCDMCELNCGDERGLTLHRKACAVMNPYSCSQCGERFCNRPKLNVRMDAHVRKPVFEKLATGEAGDGSKLVKRKGAEVKTSKANPKPPKVTSKVAATTPKADANSAKAEAVVASKADGETPKPR